MKPDKDMVAQHQGLARLRMSVDLNVAGAFSCGARSGVAVPGGQQKSQVTTYISEQDNRLLLHAHLLSWQTYRTEQTALLTGCTLIICSPASKSGQLACLQR